MLFAKVNKDTIGSGHIENGLIMDGYSEIIILSASIIKKPFAEVLNHELL
jgi:hypothetical protein